MVTASNAGESDGKSSGNRSTRRLPDSTATRNSEAERSKVFHRGPRASLTVTTHSSGYPSREHPVAEITVVCDRPRHQFLVGVLQAEWHLLAGVSERPDCIQARSTLPKQVEVLVALRWLKHPEEPVERTLTVSLDQALSRTASAAAPRSGFMPLARRLP